MRLRIAGGNGSGQAAQLRTGNQSEPTTSRRVRPKLVSSSPDLMVRAFQNSGGLPDQNEFSFVCHRLRSVNAERFRLSTMQTISGLLFECWLFLSSALASALAKPYSRFR